MSSTQHRALVIAHEPDGPGGQVAVRLRERGFDVTTHVVTEDVNEPNKAVPFPDISAYDVLALMGSIRSVTRPAEISSWLDAELDLIRAAHQAGQPVLGVCFGGQLIAEALGGSVEESPVTEIGWYEIEPALGQENPIGAGPWMEWHHDRFTAPPSANVLAVTDVGPQLFTIGRMVGTQFHPEVDQRHVSDWLAGADDAYLEEYGQNREVILAGVAANEEQSIRGCKALVDWFLDEIAFAAGDELAEANA